MAGIIPASLVPQVGFGNNSLTVASSGALTRSSAGGHAPGCRQVPTYRTRSRPSAADGCRGPAGRTPTTRLQPGRNGENGSVYFVIFGRDWARTTYRPRFEFQLVEFEVVDENQDGIFEPGECAIIQNIRVRNTGKFATPPYLLLAAFYQIEYSDTF